MNKDYILVTGGAGFIGSNFVAQILSSTQLTVINLDKLTYAGNLATLDRFATNARHIFVQGDIGDRQLIDNLLDKYQPRSIVNFAAETHVDRSIDGLASFIETNINGTFNLLESTRQYWRKLTDEAQKLFRSITSISPLSAPATDSICHRSTGTRSTLCVGDGSQIGLSISYAPQPKPAS